MQKIPSPLVAIQCGDTRITMVRGPGSVVATAYLRNDVLHDAEGNSRWMSVSVPFVLERISPVLGITYTELIAAYSKHPYVLA